MLQGSVSNFILGLESAVGGNITKESTPANSGLSTLAFTQLTLTSPIAGTTVYWELGAISWSSHTQSSGTVLIRNLTLTTSGGVAVQGDLTISGTMTAATRSFDIPHPDPSKPDHRLRHWVIESDEPGGSLIYRRQLSAVKGTNHISLPSWYAHLCADTLCFVSPVRHFGSCWADLDADGTVVLQTSKSGRYNLLISARRKDHCATQLCPQDVEYSSELPRPAEHNIHPVSAPTRQKVQ